MIKVFISESDKKEVVVFMLLEIVNLYKKLILCKMIII